MAHRESVERFLRNVPELSSAELISGQLADTRRMLELIRYSRDPALTHPRRLLEQLQERLESAAAAHPDTLAEDIGFQLCTLVESQPPLRKVFIAVANLNAADILSERLKVFEDTARERQLSDAESLELNHVREMLASFTDAARVALELDGSENGSDTGSKLF